MVSARRQREGTSWVPISSSITSASGHGWARLGRGRRAPVAPAGAGRAPSTGGGTYGCSALAAGLMELATVASIAGRAVGAHQLPQHTAGSATAVEVERRQWSARSPRAGGSRGRGSGRRASLERRCATAEVRRPAASRRRLLVLPLPWRTGPPSAATPARIRSRASVFVSRAAADRRRRRPASSAGQVGHPSPRQPRWAGTSRRQPRAGVRRRRGHQRTGAHRQPGADPCASIAAAAAARRARRRLNTTPSPPGRGPDDEARVAGTVSRSAAEGLLEPGEARVAVDEHGSRCSLPAGTRARRGRPGRRGR